jgi:hypothetical protein
MNVHRGRLFSLFVELNDVCLTTESLEVMRHFLFVEKFLTFLCVFANVFEVL